MYISTPISILFGKITIVRLSKLPGSKTSPAAAAVKANGPCKKWIKIWLFSLLDSFKNWTNATVTLSTLFHNLIVSTPKPFLFLIPSWFGNHYNSCFIQWSTGLQMLDQIGVRKRPFSFNFCNYFWNTTRWMYILL